MTVAPTPADLKIPVRNLRFHQDVRQHAAAPKRWWLADDPVATAFFNALSCTFPAGEKFFIESVRRFRDQVDAPLREQIAAFIAQESLHTREHVAFNKLATDAGYDVERLETRAKKALDFARKRSPYRQLAGTCALEHFTAILAHRLLQADSRDLDGAPEDTVRLWTWHAMEEIEHKAVAFDTFMAVTGHMWRPRRYLLRIFAMVMATTILFAVVRANMRDLYREDGHDGREIWKRTRRYLFGRDGFLRSVIPDYLRYFRPGFHPWDEDDRALLANAEARLETAQG